MQVQLTAFKRSWLIITLLIFIRALSGQDLKIKDCFIDNRSNLKFCVASDNKTSDKQFGDSYRFFLITNPDTDSVISKFYLKVNRSADFDYQLISDFYRDNNIIILKGVASFYIYSPTQNVISKNIFPDLRGCEISDGQGSFIKNLKIIDNGNTLVLQVDECGIYKFDIREIRNISQIE